MSTVPVISLWQPWASLIFAGRKDSETRSFRLPPRLLNMHMAIHATAKFPSIRYISPELHELCVDEFGCSYHLTLPQGAILGTVRVTEVVPSEIARATATPDDLTAGDWTPGRFIWRLTDVRPLATPLPAKGQQGFWKAKLGVTT